MKKLLLLGLVFMFFIIPTALADTIHCNDCASCQGYMDNTTGPRTVLLDQDITNQDGTCLTMKNNITLDCQGYIIDGDGDSVGYGIDIGTNVRNSSIQNCIIQEFQIGIYKAGDGSQAVRYNVLDNLLIRDNTNEGLYLEIDVGSSWLPFTNVRVYNNGHGLYSRMTSSLVNFTNVEFIGSGSGNGVRFRYQGKSSRFFNVTVKNWTNGFVTEDTLSTRWYDSEISDNTYGLNWDHTRSNIFNRTIFRNNDYAMRLTDRTENNQFMDCIFENSAIVHILEEADNIGYVNQFNGTLQLGPNIVGGTYTGGNYWDNYTGADSDYDGIGDTSYNLSEANNLSTSGYMDYLPLTSNDGPPSEPAMNLLPFPWNIIGGIVLSAGFILYVLRILYIRKPKNAKEGFEQILNFIVSSIIYAIGLALLLVG